MTSMQSHHAPSSLTFCSLGTRPGRSMMFAITGITGRVGGAVARILLEQAETVRAVVRSRDKGESWAALGCEVVVASVEDGAALTAAFAGTEGVFLMTPPNYDPAP